MSAAASRKILFPSIDLRGGRVVRLHQGDYARETAYGDDPLEWARAFAAGGATRLHVVDLDGARSGLMAHLDVIQRICQKTALKVQVGGGVRSRETIDDLLAAGVDRTVLGTAALEEWAWFEAIASDPAYNRRLVLGLDARQGRLAVGGWQTQTDATALEVARRVSDWPLAAIVYTDIGVDATMRGPNLAATREIAEATGVPVIASGGVGTLDHLRALRELPVGGAIVGKALYERAFTVEEAIAAFEGSTEGARAL